MAKLDSTVVYGDLSVNNKVTITDSLYVGGVVTFAGTLTTDGDFGIGNDLTVGGDATITGNVNAANATLSGPLSANAGATLTGDTTIVKAVGGYPLKLSSGGSDIGAIGIQFNGVSSQTGYFHADHKDANSQGGNYSFHLSSSETITNVVLDSSSSLSNFYVNSNPVWHAGNLVAGTGAADFAAGNHTHSTFTGYIEPGNTFRTNQYYSSSEGRNRFYFYGTAGTIIQGGGGADSVAIAHFRDNRNSDVARLDGDGFFISNARHVEGAGTDFNTLNRTGVYTMYSVSTAPNSPGISYGTLLALGAGTKSKSFATQMFTNKDGTSATYIRSRNDGSFGWYSWKRVAFWGDNIGTAATEYAAGNHNHDSVYINASGDTMTGHLTMGNKNLYGSSTSRYLLQGDVSGLTHLVTPASMVLHADTDSSNNAEYLDLKAGSNVLRVSGGAASVNDLTFNGHVVYHAGNQDHSQLVCKDDRDIKPNVATGHGDRSVRGYFTSLAGLTGSANTDYQDLLVLNTYSGTSGGKVNALAFDKSAKKIRLYQADQTATSWGAASTIYGSHDTNIGTGATNYAAGNHNHDSIYPRLNTTETISAIWTHTAESLFNAKITVKGTGTIGGSSWGGGWLKTGTSSNGISMDDNELYKFGGNFIIGAVGGSVKFISAGTITSNKSISVTGSVTASSKLIANGDVECKGDLKMTGTDSYIWTPSSASGFTGFWDQPNAKIVWKYTNGGNVDFNVPINTTEFNIKSKRGSSLDSKMRIWDGGSTRGHVWETSTPLGSYYWYCQTGTSTTGTSNHLQMNGSLTASGNITAYSDVRLKKDIEVIENALDKVKAIRGVTYTRIDTDERQTGVVAQEVEKVLPEVVFEDDIKDKGVLKHVAYGNMVGLLIEAIKEQQEQIDQLKKPWWRKFTDILCR